MNVQKEIIRIRKMTDKSLVSTIIKLYELTDTKEFVESQYIDIANEYLELLHNEAVRRLAMYVTEKKQQKQSKV